MTTCLEYWDKPESELWLMRQEIQYLLSDEFLSAKAKRWRHEDKEKLRQMYSHFEYQNDDHFKRHLWNNMIDEKRCDGGHVIKTNKSSFYEFQAHCGVKDCEPCSKIRKDKAVAGRVKGIPKQKAFYETEEGKAVKAAAAEKRTVLIEEMSKTEEGLSKLKTRYTKRNNTLKSHYRSDSGLEERRSRSLRAIRLQPHNSVRNIENCAMLAANRLSVDEFIALAGDIGNEVQAAFDNGHPIKDIGKIVTTASRTLSFITKQHVTDMHSALMRGESVYEIAARAGLLKQSVYRAFDTYGLAYDRPVSRSSQEDAIILFLSEAGIEHQRNFRPEWLKKAGKSHSMELDVYVESAKVAIEVNGRYWHTNARGLGVIDKDYHRYKFEKCMEQGIKLLQFTDKEVDDKPEVVKSIIHNALGISSEKVYARKCVLKDVDFDESSVFLDTNHLHGKGRPGKSIGLYYDDVLVSCLRYRAISGTVEVERFASLLGYSVVGAFSKLLKKVPGKVIVSYSYNDIGHGNLYEKTGFSYVGEVKNSYRYWMSETDEFVHRSHWQKHKLLKVFGGDSSMTELELAYENGVFAYYDSGYKKWSLTRPDVKNGHSS